MAENKDRREETGREVASFRAAQQEMAAISRQYSQERQAVWERELEAMTASWQGFHQDWRGTLEQMAGAAAANFDDMGTRGEAAANLVAQSWRQALVEITGKITNKGDRRLDQVDLNAVFYDPYGQVVLRERVSIVRPRTGGLAPEETKRFRLAFDNIPQSWNQAMPQLVIAGIRF